jgi:hypothetical protein
MKPFLPAFLLWISLLALVVGSCKAPQVVISRAEHISSPEAPMAMDSLKTGLRAQVVYGEQELSGRMMLKKTGDGVYKVAFFNELGMTYLDGSYILSGRAGKFTPNTIAPDLDRKAFLRSFEKALGGIIEH